VVVLPTRSLPPRPRASDRGARTLPRDVGAASRVAGSVAAADAPTAARAGAPAARRRARSQDDIATLARAESARLHAAPRPTNPYALANGRRALSADDLPEAAEHNGGDCNCNSLPDSTGGFYDHPPKTRGEAGLAELRRELSRSLRTPVAPSARSIRMPPIRHGGDSDAGEPASPCSTAPSSVGPSPTASPAVLLAAPAGAVPTFALAPSSTADVAPSGQSSGKQPPPLALC